MRGSCQPVLDSANAGVHIVADPEKEHWGHGAVEAAIQDITGTAGPEAGNYTPTGCVPLDGRSTRRFIVLPVVQWAYGSVYHMTDKDLRTFKDSRTRTPPLFAGNPWL